MAQQPTPLKPQRPTRGEVVDQWFADLRTLGLPPLAEQHPLTFLAMQLETLKARLREAL